VTRRDNEAELEKIRRDVEHLAGEFQIYTQV
jgi:hypothetical protein